MKNKEYILNTIRARQKEFLRLGIREIGLFGSYARDEQTRESDIDILIDFEPEKETFDNYMAVYELLEKLFRDTKVEIVTKKGLSPYIGPKILNEVQYVQRAG
jgi:predicted nucleotidyltransferase